MPANLYLLFRAEHRFFEFKMQILAKVGPTLGPAATPAALSKHVAETEDVAEDVAEILEDGGIESRGTPRTTSYTSVPEAVV